MPCGPRRLAPLPRHYALRIRPYPMRAIGRRPAIQRKNCIFAAQKMPIRDSPPPDRHSANLAPSHEQHLGLARYGARAHGRTQKSIVLTQRAFCLDSPRSGGISLTLFQLYGIVGSCTPPPGTLPDGCAVIPPSRLQCSTSHVQCNKNQSHSKNGGIVRCNSPPVASQSCAKTVVFTGLQLSCAMKSVCQTVERKTAKPLFPSRTSRSTAGTS
ncbi:hypothetical protein FHT17_003568 [Novosphingobium sp. SG916]|nr:hypothetical protein [Novosphingobium sp. SG919]NMN88661.1 hypothetical protein [Novosphingobium sp. SG916]